MNAKVVLVLHLLCIWIRLATSYNEESPPENSANDQPDNPDELEDDDSGFDELSDRDQDTSFSSSQDTCGILAPPAPRHDDSINIGFSRMKRHTIIGGRVSHKFAPWMVGIYRRTSNFSLVLCGGALIRPNFVLTAGHCFIKTMDARTFWIRVAMRDSHVIDFDEHVFEAEHIFVNPRYAPPLSSWDVALIKLKDNALSFSSRYRLICLPEPNLLPENLIGQEAVVAGWGTTGFAGRQSRYLRELMVPIVDNKECDRAYRALETYNRSFTDGVSMEFMCAGTILGGKDSCQGDSGGPLMLKINGRWTVVGVVSTGYRCAYKGFYGIYTRLNYVLDYVLSVVNDNS